MQPRRAPQPSPIDRTAVARALRHACRTARSDPAAARLEVLSVTDAANEAGLSADESKLSIGDRTAVRLVEHGLPWVAMDVTAHVVDAQPFATSIRRGRVFVWLPGFGDPRVGAREDIYDISDRIVLRCAVDEVRWADGKCLIGGFAHLSHLVAEPEDEVVLVLRRSDGTAERLGARRVRRPDRVVDGGANLTRLAWSGFCAEIADEILRDATLALEAQVSRSGVVRSGRLVASAATGLTDLLPFDLVTAGRPLHVAAGSSLTLARSPSASARRRTHRLPAAHWPAAHWIARTRRRRDIAQGRCPR